MPRVRLPHLINLRDYQIPVFRVVDAGCKRVVLVWHRRTGKDKTCLNLVFKKMFERVGAYYYMFPTLVQGRKAIWDGIDGNGFKFMDHLPSELIKKKNEAEMKIEAINGSIFRILGADNFDGSMGSNPIFMVFSEFSLMHPRVWAFFRPILAENGGTAIFNFTPRGENHGYDIYELAKSESDEWYCDLLTAEDTKILPREVLERERREIIRLYGDDTLYRQEYMCDFSAPIAGAYYAEHITTAYREGRIGNVVLESRYPVHTYWDIGVGDTTAIWFAQRIGSELRLIDYHEESGKGLPHFAKVLADKKYVYGEHWAPHDIKVREWGGNGKARIDTAASLGINFSIVPNLRIMDGIDAARALWPRVWIDKSKCKDGINALKSYHKEYDEGKKRWVDNPYHDWSSNAADAFRYMALAVDFESGLMRPRDKYDKANMGSTKGYQNLGRPDAA